MIYLDCAATSLHKPASVLQAVNTAMQSAASSGRGGYGASMSASELLYSCREEAAALFHVKGCEHVVFTFNATHALNLAIHALCPYKAAVVVSGFEHNSVTRPLAAREARLRIAGRKLFDRENTLREFSRLLPGAQLAVCTYVSNAFGFVLPIYEISELCRKHHVPLIMDASQAAGVLEIDFERLNAAFIAMPGHKGLYGPQGTGLLLCERPAKPLLLGGTGSESRLQQMPQTLPDCFEAGTHNVCGIAGLREGIRFVRSQGTDAIRKKEQRLLGRMTELLQREPKLRLFTGEGQTGVLSLSCEGIDSEELSQRLAQRGICVRGGLHCAPFAHESAGTLREGTVRMSVNAFTELSDVESACRSLLEIVENSD